MLLRPSPGIDPVRSILEGVVAQAVSCRPQQETYRQLQQCRAQDLTYAAFVERFMAPGEPALLQVRACPMHAGPCLCFPMMNIFHEYGLLLV